MYLLNRLFKHTNADKNLNKSFVLQIKEATNINSLFWLGFGLGRLGGVLFFKYFKPSTIILVDFAGTVLCMIIMVIYGEESVPVAWVITAFYSFLQGTVYPGGVSWASQYINMSGSYIWIFSAGQALGTMTLVPASGFLFDQEPFSVMYVVLGCSVLNAITFLVMLLEGRRLGGKLAESDDLTTLVSSERISESVESVRGDTEEQKSRL